MKSTQKFPRRVAVLNVEELDVESLPPGAHRLRLELGEDGTSAPIRAPVHVIKGHQPGPVVGITAAIHGNEVNGIPTIHRLYRRLKAAELAGTVIAAAPVNVPGFLRNQREYKQDRARQEGCVETSHRANMPICVMA